VAVFLGKVAKGFEVFNLGVWTPMIVSISRNRTSLLAQLEPCIKSIAAKFEQTADMTLTFASVNSIHHFLAQIITIGGRHRTNSRSQIDANYVLTIP
jgi:hypothetical protein